MTYRAELLRLHELPNSDRETAIVAAEGGSAFMRLTPRLPLATRSGHAVLRSASVGYRFETARAARRPAHQAVSRYGSHQIHVVSPDPLT
jgi:hypothetical protein